MLPPTFSRGADGDHRPRSGPRLMVTAPGPRAGNNHYAVSVSHASLETAGGHGQADNLMPRRVTVVRHTAGFKFLVFDVQAGERLAQTRTELGPAAAGPRASSF